MDTTKPTPRERIQTISGIIRFVWILFIIFELATVLTGIIVLLTENGGYLVKLSNAFTFRFVCFSSGNEFTPADGAFIPFGDFSTVSKVLYILGIMPLHLFILKNLYHFQKLFYYYSRGNIFTSEANLQIRLIGVTSCFIGLFRLLSDLLQRNAIALTLRDAKYGIQFYPGDWDKVIFSLIFGATVICVAWVMEAGRETRVDQELTI